MNRKAQTDVGERIAIYSRLPPPYGGVTVHSERLIERAREEGIPHQAYNQSAKAIPDRDVKPVGESVWAGIKFLLTVREPVVHFHNNGLATIISSLGIASLRGKRSILTIHSERPIRHSGLASPAVRWLLRHSLRRAYHVFCVSERIAQWLVGMGVREDAITIAPAFLLPTALHVSPDNLSPEIAEFLDAHSSIVGTHGWFGYFVNGVHLYSFDMVVSMAKYLKENFPQSGLYTVVSGTYDEEHRETILRAREELGYEKDWLIVEEPFHAAALYAKTDVFVRPTTTDGDSVSIRECLYLGVPVIASDAVDRPPECVVFPSRDTDAMLQRVGEVLNDLDGYRSRLQTNTIVDSSGEILDVYRESLRRSVSGSD
jgi:glycosyltransferase involved in cell wall biosynthesis